MNTPADLKYTNNDEWVRVDGDTAISGVTDYAQNALSDVVYVELPSVGDTFAQNQAYGSVESVKAASEVYLALSGTITEVNDALTTQPELVNSDPYGAGWMVKFKASDLSELGNLMDVAAYIAYCDSRKH